MKTKGFTLIELMIVIAIIGIVAAIVVPLLAPNSDKVSVGFTGVVEMRCIDGYKFAVSHNQTRQVMDEFGHGVRCDNGHQNLEAGSD